MHSRNSEKFSRGASAAVKKISFKKDTNRHKNDKTKHSSGVVVSSELKDVQNSVDKPSKHRNELPSTSQQPIASSSVESSTAMRQQIKVKRKSLIGISRCVKKRLSSFDCTVNLPSNRNEASDGGSVPSHSDSLTDFWGDDHLFADFNISDVIHTSTESNKINSASTPIVKVNSVEKSSKGRDLIEQETFYGLPMTVKNMFSQYRGIEELYGEFDFFSF